MEPRPDAEDLEQVDGTPESEPASPPVQESQPRRPGRVKAVPSKSAPSRATPKPATQRAATSKTVTPESSTPKSSTPKSATPRAATSKATTPTSSAPKSTTPQREGSAGSGANRAPTSGRGPAKPAASTRKSSPAKARTAPRAAAPPRTASAPKPASLAAALQAPSTVVDRPSAARTAVEVDEKPEAEAVEVDAIEVEETAGAEDTESAESGIAEPQIAEPQIAEPQIAEPEIEGPAADEPAVDGTAIDGRAVDEPAADERTVDERIVDEPTEASAPTNGPRPTTAVLSVRGLTKRFDGTVAVDQVDIAVAAGTIFGIVGPNGAGKTTTLSMVTGLLRPDAGTVHVHGADVWKDPVAAKRNMGVLPDRLRLFDRLTGAQLLYYSGTLRGLDRKTVKSRTVDLAAAFGLEEALGRLVTDYSAGMTKKIALAAAMIHSPRLLILDEPFEAVDPVSAANVIEILQKYAAAGGTVVMSSHSMDLIQRICDAVSIIVRGSVLASGTMDEVRAGATLEERFVELAGGRKAAEGMEWLHNFSA